MNAIPTPARVPSPGNILSHELAARGLTQDAFATILGRPARLISEIIHGKKQITPAIALELAEVLGTSSELWVNLESSYQLHRERKRQ